VVRGDDGDDDDDMPVWDKGELVGALRAAVAEAEAFVRAQGIDPDAIIAAPAADFAKARLLEDAVESLLINDDTKETFLALARAVAARHAAILPDPAVY